ncbi:hypothetical protein ACHAQJ_003063 [Trichoderma viride]
MERYLANIIARRSFRFYVGSQNGLRYLSSSTVFYAQAKSPSVKDKVGSTQNSSDKLCKKEKAIVLEVACQIAALKKGNRKANRRREIVLLDATPERQFCSEIIIDLEETDATDTAIEISKLDANHQHRVFFVDGSRITKPTKKSGSSAPGGNSVTHRSAAVVYKSSNSDQSWEERRFALPSGPCSTLAEVAAIAEGLAEATTVMMILRSQSSTDLGKMAPNYKVTIFTDSTAALTKIKKLRKENAITNAQLRNDPIVCKLITRSQHLRRIGVQLELRWVPSRSKVEGHTRADKVAKYAAKNPDIGVRLDEGLRLIEMEAASNTTTKKDQNKICLEGNCDGMMDKKKPKAAVTSELEPGYRQKQTWISAAKLEEIWQPISILRRVCMLENLHGFRRTDPSLIKPEVRAHFT